RKIRNQNLFNRIFFVCFLDNRFKKYNLLNKGMRLEDARPKANSRGFLNPWEKDGSLEIRLEDGERQRVRGFIRVLAIGFSPFADDVFLPNYTHKIVQYYNIVET
ncbi:MAG: hypothetical protein IKU94_05005, partial [Bacteroidaceae bacterium]|nr:hypothetical protein [Bacteroidaceae bacterium]